MEQICLPEMGLWNESPRLLAWAIRQGEVTLEEAAGWIAAEAPEALLARATLLWPLVWPSLGPGLDARTRESLRGLTRDAAVVASETALRAWLQTLQAGGEIGETAWLTQRLMSQPGAWARWRAWGPFLLPASVAATLAASAEPAVGASLLSSLPSLLSSLPSLLAALPEGEREAFLRTLAPAASHPEAARALLACASALASGARDRVVAACVPHLPADVLAEVQHAETSEHGEHAENSKHGEHAENSEHAASPVTFPALTLLGLAARLPPDEGLSLAFDVLLRAEEAGPARLAEVSPFVPQPLVDEAVKRQRRAQSPARPRALAALAARTTHPAVRQRLFHEAYHETRFRHDHSEALRVIPLAAPFLPDDALRWAGALPASPAVLSMLADLLSTLPSHSDEMASKLLALALTLLAGVSTDELCAQPDWAAASTRLANAAPSSHADQLVPLASRLPPDARLPFWEALAPRLAPSVLVALLEDVGAWSKQGPARWWNTSLVELVPPDLVRGAVTLAVRQR